jgi:hypothetical protein
MADLATTLYILISLRAGPSLLLTNWLRWPSAEPICPAADRLGEATGASGEHARKWTRRLGGHARCDESVAF